MLFSSLSLLLLLSLLVSAELHSQFDDWMMMVEENASTILD